MKYNVNLLLWIGTTLSCLAFIFSMEVFVHISSIPMETRSVWKFYASLAGLTIFAAIFVVNIVLLVMRPKK